VGELGAEARRERLAPLEVSAALVGSCTNSSYEDITRAASIAAGRGRQRPEGEDR
jgi:aconitate hydratase